MHYTDDCNCGCYGHRCTQFGFVTGHCGIHFIHMDNFIQTEAGKWSPILSGILIQFIFGALILRVEVSKLILFYFDPSFLHIMIVSYTSVDHKRQMHVS